MPLYFFVRGSVITLASCDARFRVLQGASGILKGIITLAALLLASGYSVDNFVDKFFTKYLVVIKSRRTFDF
jgi:hypothetical protein